MSCAGAITAEYKTWQGIRQRCENPNDPGFSRYGGRGIVVCERWRASFENFFADMGLRPSSKHSIERVDNDNDYAPSNCRWATAKEQQWNKSNSTTFTIGGETKTFAGWWSSQIEMFGELRTIGEWVLSVGMTERFLRSRMRNAKRKGRVLDLMSLLAPAHHSAD
jgi:hypothetical protein